jgi:hypothetical protein
VVVIDIDEEILMKNNEFSGWANLVRELLAELASQQSDYPFGTNELREPSPNHADLPGELQPLYAVFDGMSLPDVHIGYFIDSAERVASASKRGEPVVVEGRQSIPIQVFGSDGGGDRFALGTVDGAVYFLPASGAVRNGKFIEDDVVTVRRISGSVIGFLERLGSDIEAFVHGREGHVYLDRDTVDPTVA